MIHHRHFPLIPSIRVILNRSSIHVVLTLGHEDEDGCGLGVGGAAGVVAGVGVVGLADGKAALGLRPRFRLHGDSTPRRVVVDHAVVMVPEHVLGRLGALKSRRVVTMKKDQ